jgi:hypothetical protein
MRRTFSPGRRFRAIQSAQGIGLAAILAIVVAGCGAAGAKDPYQLVTDSAAGSWDPIQVNVALSFQGPGSTVEIPESAIAFVLDKGGKKGGLHLAIPVKDLGANPLALETLGIKGDTLDFDALFDGAAFYGRSPILARMIEESLTPTQHLPSGDLTGWLKLGTAQEFAALAMLAARAAPSMAVPSNLPTSVRESLDEMGVNVTLAGTEKHGTADAYHLTATIDLEKLFNSPVFATADPATLAQARRGIKELTLTADAWVDVATTRATELDLHLATTSEPKTTGDIRITARDPDGSVTLAAPTSSVDIPLSKMIGDMLRLMGGGATS